MHNEMDLPDFIMMLTDHNMEDSWKHINIYIRPYIKLVHINSRSR